jgi:predicted fused transcriptional regulator/phosphomethylpyrimidine kinase/predicted transcriptional regulator
MLLHELISSKILPALRGVLAHRLHSLGVSQRKIAAYLDTTQPMISRVLKRDVEEYYSELKALGLSRDLVDHYVNILVDMVINEEYLKFVITSFGVINRLAITAFCQSEREATELCVRGEIVDPDIEHYKRVLNLLITTPCLDRLLPEIGSNLVYSPRPPRGLGDIIGLSGRIMRSTAGAVTYGYPMYGGSRHVSRVFLLVARGRPDIRYGFNLRYSEEVCRHLESLGLRVVYTGPHSSLESFWASVERSAELRPDAICDSGGYGLEPVVYVFTDSHEKLLQVLRSLGVKLCGE